MIRRTPFDVEPKEIELLGPGFAAFVNSLLAAESARADLGGEQLRTGSRDNVADGGVDAHLVSSTRTRWLPEGDTAWQFKSGDLQPARCKTELRGASWARDLVTSGASYRLVLGAALGGAKIERRRDALIEVAVAEGLLGPGEEERIQVLDADHLARWASEFPAISQTPELRGMVPQILPFNLWAETRRHQSSWVGDDDRNEVVESIRQAVTGHEHVELRVAGPSGVGKTRLVMEALRTETLGPLVAYVDDAEGLDASMMSMLATGDYHAVLVVDECTPKTHERLAARLLEGRPLRLLTIGEHREERGYPLRCPIWVVPGMPQEALHEFLNTNHPGLSSEARRLVAGHVGGNVRYAAVLADRVLNSDGETVAELIKSGDLSELLALEVPDGDGFFFSQALALPERFGFEGGLEDELKAIAAFVGTSDDRLRVVVQELEERGLIEAHGRYRAVAPDPLATYLAAHAWQTWGPRILTELLPALGSAMRTSIFRRAASLGRYEPVRAQFVSLLGDPQLFGSLQSIEERNTSELLLHLAVVAPNETMDHLSAVVGQHTSAELRGMENSRRNLVWALEKLAWHSATFERGADVLLKLALAENESFSNNATGVWLALFGTMLPATAASTEQRLQYLRGKVASTNPEVRRLVVRAAATGLEWHESVSVSGELQGGTVVEKRGMPATYGEAADHRVALAQLLRELCDDSVEEVAEAARDALLRTVHPFADDELVWPRLKSVLLSLDARRLGVLRSETEDLLRLHERVRGDDGDSRRPQLVSSLRNLLADLPQPTERERLESLASREPWDFSDDEAARADLTAAVVERVRSVGPSRLIDWAVERQPPSAWYLGHALVESGADTEAVLSQMTAQLPSTEVMLAGYLAALEEQSGKAVFDEFLDRGLGADIGSELRLRLTVRGPVSPAAADRVERLAGSVPVGLAARLLMPWTNHLLDETCLKLLRAWAPQISNQEDYNAVVDWAALWLHGREDLPRSSESDLAELLLLRGEHPEVGQQSWDWSQLASRLLDRHAVAIAQLLLELVSSGDLMLPHHEEARVLQDAAKEDPTTVWTLVAARLEGGDWRVSMSLRGFFLHAIPVEVIREWVGQSPQRAELVADIAPVGGMRPSPYASLLLTEFGDSERVAGSLAGELSSGTWVGPWSNRIRNQIQQMDQWLAEPDLSSGVKDWARRMKSSLERQLAEAVQREAEELY